MFENLEIYNDKKEILKEILKENPRERKAYMYIINHGLLSKEVVTLSEKVCIKETLEKEIENAIKYEKNVDENYINALALLKNKSKEEIYDVIEEEDRKKQRKRKNKNINLQDYNDIKCY